MRKWIAFFLIGICVSTQTEFHQLLKLPVLVQHFMEHREKDSSTSLLAFLKEHYSAFDERDADYDRDMQLPFKTHDCVNAAVVFYNPAPSFDIVSIPSFEAIASFPITRETSLPTTTTGNIWQPPRV